MGKKSIPLIIGAIFSITILLVHDYSYAQVTVYDVTSTTAGETMSMGSGGAGDNIFVGEEITGSSALLDTQINRVTMFMSDVQTPEGTITVGVWDSTVAPTEENVSCVIDTITAEQVDILHTNAGEPANGVEVTFIKTNGFCLLEANTMLGAYYNEVGSTLNGIVIKHRGADAFDSSNTRHTRYSTSFTDSTSNDVSGTWQEVVGEEIEVCIDTDLNGDVDLCFQDTNLDGVPDNGFAGSLGAFNSNANITQMGNDWFAAFNIGDTENNPNIETNGVGVFFLLVIIIISYGLIVGIHIMAQRALRSNQVVVMDALKINPVLLVIMLVIDVGFAWYLNFVGDIIFYTTIAVVVGMAGLGIYREVRG